jgi:hypothetical protein
MYGQPNDFLTALALIAVVGFLGWLVFFTGDGYKGIAKDLRSLGGKKVERFPVPIFDRSKIELPRPAKPTVKPIVRTPVDFNEEQLRDWARQLQQSIADLRKEAAELAKAYNSLPPSLVEDPAKPPAQAKAKVSPAKKTVQKKPAAKKPAAKKPIAKKPVKKAAPTRSTAAKTTKKAAPKKKGR